MKSQNGFRWVGPVLGCLAIDLLAAGAAASAASEPTSPGAGDGLAWQAHDLRLQVGGDLLGRYETWNWFGDLNDDYDFHWGRARIHLRANMGEHLEFFVEPQFVVLDNLPDDGVAPVPRGPSGMGGLYYLHSGEDSPDSLGFHQAWLKVAGLADVPVEVTLGRFAYASGLEHVRIADGPKFNALKEMRLGDRMISSFDWAAFARSFDGARADCTTASGTFSLSASLMYPTQGGWEEDFNRTMDDVRIVSVVGTVAKDAMISGSEIAVFAYHYDDARRCSQRVDNSGQAAAEADISVVTAGAHWLGLHPLGDGQVDTLLWGCIQDGDWYEQNHQAFAVAAEVGYQLPHLLLKPWLRAGCFLGSGDPDPGDDTHETFLQMAPGTRKYQLFPYYDLQNMESVFLQCILFPRKDLKLRFDYSVNRLAKDDDRWYMGTGPTQNAGAIYGYLGRPSQGDDALSAETSIMVTWDFNPQWSINVFYCHVWGDDVIENLYPEENDADYASLELTFKF